MSRTIAGVVALLCALATLSITPAARAEEPLRVLATGDSITNGRHLDYTWRFRLYQEFRRQGRPVDMVGSRSMPYVDPGYPTSTYADPDFDQDHFALAGATLASLPSKIGPEVAAQQPDVVVLEAGVNDLLHGAQPADVAASLRAWVAAVREAQPTTGIILCTVLDVENKPDVNAGIAAYNALMREVAIELSTESSPITVADTTGGWDPADHSLAWDGIHPTPTGDTLIAGHVAEAFEALGLLGPSDLFHAVPWPRQEPVSVAVTGRWATVTWERQAITGGVVRWHRVGAPWLQTKPAPYGTRVFAVTSGATYEFRVQLWRRFMAGPWGPIRRVRVAPVLVPPPAPVRVFVGPHRVHWSASRGASGYVVRYRKVHRQHWWVRRLPGTQLSVGRVAVAEVRAVNAAGTSRWRLARR